MSNHAAADYLCNSCTLDGNGTVWQWIPDIRGGASRVFGPGRCGLSVRVSPTMSLP
jgi:hypothetical protein